MALGAFLAGVLLAESEYRRELETDIEPFKGLLLGLFFIAVGMGIDVGVVIHHPWQVAGIVVGFLRRQDRWCCGGWRSASRSRGWSGPVFTLLLAQGGEFGFVVLQAAQGRQVITGTARAGVLTAAITLVDAADAAVDAAGRPLVDPAAGQVAVRAREAVRDSPSRRTRR